MKRKSTVNVSSSDGFDINHPSGNAEVVSFLRNTIPKSPKINMINFATLLQLVNVLLSSQTPH